MAGDVDQQVAGQRQDLGAAVGRIELDEHDHVASGTVGLSEVLQAFETLSGVGTDHEKNDGLSVLRRSDVELGRYICVLGHVLVEGRLTGLDGEQDEADPEVGEEQKADNGAPPPTSFGGQRTRRNRR